MYFGAYDQGHFQRRHKREKRQSLSDRMRELWDGDRAEKAMPSRLSKQPVAMRASPLYNPKTRASQPSDVSVIALPQADSNLCSS